MTAQILRYHPGEFQKGTDHRFGSSARIFINPFSLTSVPSKPLDDTPIFREIYPPTEETERRHDGVYREPSPAYWKRILSRDPDVDIYKHRWTLTARSHCTAMVLSDYPFPDRVRRNRWVQRGLERAARFINPHGILDTDWLRARVRQVRCTRLLKCFRTYGLPIKTSLGRSRYRQSLLALPVRVQACSEEVFLQRYWASFDGRRHLDLHLGRCVRRQLPVS